MNVRGLYDKGWAEMDRQVNRLTMGERQKISDAAYADVQRAAVVIGYLNARGVAVGSDNGHGDGIKEARRMCKAVRKAVGYTLP